MRHFSGSILGNARILAAILDHDVRDIDVTNDVAVHGHVLANHKPVCVSVCGFARRTADEHVARR